MYKLCTAVLYTEHSMQKNAQNLFNTVYFLSKNKGNNILQINSIIDRITVSDFTD